MTQILIVSETPSRADLYALALADAGLEVEALTDIDAARGRLSETPADMLVIDVTSADGPPGMLVSQARAAWPDAILVALTSSADMACSGLSKMGLWSPDAEFRQPVSPQRLLKEAQRLLATTPA